MRYSLRGILVFTVVASIFFAIIAAIGRRVQTTNYIASRVDGLNGTVGDNIPGLGPREIYFSLAGLQPLVTDSDVEGISNSLSNLGSVQYISFAGTGIGDDSVNAITIAVGDTLLGLDLSGTRITENAAVWLPRCRRLNTLSLPYEALSVNSIELIAELPLLEHLHVFSVPADADLSCIADACPKIEVHLYRCRFTNCQD